MRITNLVTPLLRLPKDCSPDEMKNFRESLFALMLSYILAFAVLEGGVSSHHQRHRRFHAPRHFNKLKTELSELNSVNHTLPDDEYDYGCYDFAKFAKLAMNCDAKSPSIVFGLNKNGVSGGFGDRLGGMVTTFYLAMMTNSSFDVQWKQPYNLSDYFVVPRCLGHVGPGKNGIVDGSKDGDRDASDTLESDQRILRSAIDVRDYFTDAWFLNDTGKNLEINTNSYHWKQIVQNQAFEDRALSLGLSELSQAELFKLAVDFLLGNPTSIVKDSYASVLRQLAEGFEPNDFGPSYIGVQIRLGGGAVSGWQDPSRHSMDNVQCFAKEAVRLCRLMHIRSIFVTADSEAAVRAFEGAVLKESASDSFPPIVIQVPGTIAHTDRSIIAKEHAKEIWLKSILDWWVLKHASALVVSRSSFGETAAISSEAELALRLRLSSADGFSSAAGGASQSCEFDDLLLRDREVFQ